MRAGTAEPEKPDIQPSEVYTPGTLLGRTITYGGKEVPLYCDRSLNTFADLDFAWSLDKPDRLEYLGDEFRTRYGVDISSYQGTVDWNAVANDNIDFAMIRVATEATAQAA